MQRTRLLLLAFVLLFSQVVLTMHVASHHDNKQLCELCVVASNQDHAIVATTSFAALTIGFTPLPVDIQAGVSQAQYIPYSVRAPPLYL